MRRGFIAYILCFAAGLAGVVIAFSGLVLGLDRVLPQHLPPPAISNRINFDERLHFLRARPGIDPRLLAIGSSITVRHFDGSAFVTDGLPASAILDGGTQGVQMNQTRYLTSFYLARFHRIERVVSFVAPPDFVDCTATKAQFFDPKDAVDYAFRRAFLPRFYLEYFYLPGFLKRLPAVADDRSGNVKGKWDPVYMDAFGSTPLIIPEAQKVGLRHGTEALDPLCFQELRDLALDLAARRIAFTVVIFPVNPRFYAELADGTRYVDSFAGQTAAALAETRAQLIDLHGIAGYGPADFVDAFHMEWPAAREVSHRIAALMEGPPAPGAATASVK